MARRRKEADLAAEHREHQITEALDRKRRLLDQEIAEFKAEKEHEYRVLENTLRRKDKENSAQDIPQNQRKRGPFEQKTAAAEASSTRADYTKRDLKDGKYGPMGLGLETEDLKATIRPSSSPKGSPKSPNQPTEALHEREKDFQGFFKSSYLPLVGDTPSNEGSTTENLLQPPSFSSRNLSKERHNNSAILSSSAESVHPPMISPPLPPYRPLSSSVPPEKPSHHRRDSPRSDNSIASLRSSLRDPKQPRSPKRVLFSIDDTLVSPSTSPIAQRLKSAMPKKPVDYLDTIGSFETFEVIKKQNDNGSAASRSQSNGVPFSSSAPANGWTASFSTLGAATEPNLLKPSSSANEADDFEHQDSDDLFTFDEDMGRADKNRPQETDHEKEYNEDVDVDRDEMENKDSITASSPHAGSLPIEIKWPGRRESRG